MKHDTLAVLLVLGILAPISGHLFAHPIASPVDADTPPAFDITNAEATTDGRLLTFAMDVAGVAGSVKPVPIGRLTGARVQSYVWPTSMDPSIVGFDANSGILALAITAHPDFDDTPLYDENRDGDPANDGADWHSHWVVLVEDESCGAGLKVRDVSPGQDLLPATAPYLPIALDSPGMSPVLDGSRARITVPVENAADIAFDAVTAELQVNENGGAPLLCVTGVHDVASGDLSLPGRVMED
ncbi:hypothetical protein [Parasphingopyxis lamellibrachiae]|uniref:Uncharacterized protein n=1 Tax=Parasphingopyxis lamellibrachiae TaxID=680125 RepID=A0A3D9FBF5_9SPHN|nr:hypothetical protein [Parasphingopyxis lamellibrachiae]RED15150.1 hypothetical protein DFR46_0137 [Parasphingopyxis lamellibrachiae]